LRTKTLDDLIRAFVAQHTDAVVLDLGCGLDPRPARCNLPTSVDWYDIDFAVVAELRKRLLPQITSHIIGADLTAPGWMDDLPADRPAMLVADGLMAFMSGQAFKNMTARLTSHFSTGELRSTPTLRSTCGQRTLPLAGTPTLRNSPAQAFANRTNPSVGELA
jgi:O-methyltransferase involved in polyketide biosynthesis